MQCTTIDNLPVFSNRSRRPLQLQRFSLRRWLLTFRTAVLRTLLEVTAVIVLVLIPWNTVL
jgi:hypothetical protein